MNRYSFLTSCCLFVCLAVAPLFSGVTAWGVLIFDEGHGQKFLNGKSGELQLSGLAAQFEQAGFEVKAVASPLSAEVLSSGDALVLSGPFVSYSAGEIEAIAAFLEKGGRLAVMLHIGQPAAELLARLGVDFSNRPIHEQENIIGNNSINFKVTRFEPHALTTGLEETSFYGAWALSIAGDAGTAVAWTSAASWVDLDGSRSLSAADAVQPFAVAVTGTLGKGKFVVFGDDALFQNKFLDSANMQFANNLALWFEK